MSEPEVESDAPLVVTVEYVARKMGLALSDLDADQQFRLREAILDAQADVAAYLNQPVVPTQYVETGRIPYPDGWRLTYEPVVSIVSSVPEVYPEDNTLTGYFTVTYLAGLDAANDPNLRPIRNEVATRVMENTLTAAIWREVKGDAARRIRSSSVEGQAATYDWLTPGGGVETSGSGGNAGLSPDQRLERLKRWKRRSVFQRRGEPYPSGLAPLGTFYR